MAKPIIKKRFALPLRKPSTILRLCNQCGGEEHKPSGKCTFCGSTDLRDATSGEQPPARIYFGIGPGCWGMGVTPEKAGTSMLNNWIRFVDQKGARCQLWEAPRGAYVDHVGRIAYPKDAVPPVMLKEVTL